MAIQIIHFYKKKKKIINEGHRHQLEQSNLGDYKTDLSPKIY